MSVSKESLDRQNVNNYLSNAIEQTQMSMSRIDNRDHYGTPHQSSNLSYCNAALQEGAGRR